MKQKLPILVLFCYNRLGHLKNTISALKKNYNFENYNLIIFSDGPKNKIDDKKIRNVRNYLSTLKIQK